MTNRTILALIVTAAVVAVVLGAFFLVGSPGQERLRRFDDQRSQDLQNIRYSGIDEYARRTGKLPDTLDAVMGTIFFPGKTSISDPRTGEPYGYEKTGDATYRLCATFDLPSDPETSRVMNDVLWTHGAGTTCFAFELQTVGPNSKSSVPIR